MTRKNTETILRNAVKQMQNHLRAEHYDQAEWIARKLAGILKGFREQKLKQFTTER